MGNQQPPAISIHALREEGDSAACRQTTMSIISIHALREEGDAPPIYRLVSPKYFYPRPPRGGRPLSRRKAAAISAYFYPRPPRGGRPEAGFKVHPAFVEFLSTPSAGRATLHSGRRVLSRQISIHALRGEGDGTDPIFIDDALVFLSTPSAGRATP